MLECHTRFNAASVARLASDPPGLPVVEAHERTEGKAQCQQGTTGGLGISIGGVPGRGLSQ